MGRTSVGEALVGSVLLLLLVQGGWSECPAGVGTVDSPVLVASPSAATWIGTQTVWEVCPSRAAEEGDYYWTFGDGLGRVRSATGWVSYAWGAPGPYAVRMHLNSARTLEAAAYVRQCSATSRRTSPYVLALGQAEVGQELVFWLCPGGSSLTTTTTTTYKWDMGDGHASEAVAEQVAYRYSYLRPGSYRVTVSNGTDSYGIDVDVAAASSCPLHGIAGPLQVDVLEPVVFSVCALAVGSAQLHWSFGDGSQLQHQGPSVRHTFSKAGAFTVTARLSGSATASAWSLSHVSVSDCRGVDLDAGSSVVVSGSNVVPYSPVSLAACLAFAEGAVPQRRSYQWAFGDGSQTSSSPALASASHAYLLPGTYVAVVTVASHYNGSTAAVVTTASTSLTVAAGNSAACPFGVVVAAASNASSSSSSSPSIVSVNTPVTFTACGVDLAAYPQHTWLYGDGSSGSDGEHTYRAAGLYNVVLQLDAASSYQGSVAVLRCASNEEETRIVVVGRRRYVDEQVTMQLCPGSDHAAAFAAASAKLFQWSLGDGAVGRRSPVEQAYVHSYAAVGVYNVSVAVYLDGAAVPLVFTAALRIVEEVPADQSNTAEVVVGIIFSIISGLLFLSGFVYLAYRHFRKHTGTAFSVSRPSKDYFLMRNEDDPNHDDDDDDDDDDDRDDRPLT